MMTLRNLVKILVGGSITLLCLFVFFRQVDVTALWAAFAGFQWVYLILGGISLAIGYSLRIVRWSMMLKATGAQTTFGRCSAPFLGSIALNNVLPLRLGDVARALVFPKAMGIPKVTATSSLIVERLLDLVTLLICLAVGLVAIQTIVIPATFQTSMITLACVSGLLLILGFLFSESLGRLFMRWAERSVGIKRRICEALGSLLEGFNLMSRPRLLLSMLVISMLVWTGELGLFYFVLLGVGGEGSLSVALLVMAIAVLSTLIPSAPGYVGSFHLAAFTAISLAGAASVQAGSYAVIVHLLLWVLTTLAGAFAIWAKPELFRV